MIATNLWRPPRFGLLLQQLAAFLKAVEDAVFEPVIWMGMSSPAWGTGLGFLLGWPYWLTACVALSPVTSLLLAGLVHTAIQSWTDWLPGRSSPVEEAITLFYLAGTLVVPLAGHYLAGW